MIRVLIAEDEQIEREFIARIVRSAQPEAQLLQADNGEAALRLYQEQRPEIVFLDINMPVYNGLEVLQRIRAMALFPSKVFILTAYDYFSYAQEAIHLGRGGISAEAGGAGKDRGIAEQRRGEAEA